MCFVLFLTSLVGTAYFALLPIYAPPVVLQAEEVPRFLMGLVATVCASLARGRRAIVFGRISLVLIFFAYMLILATIGLALEVVWLARSLMSWLPETRNRP